MTRDQLADLDDHDLEMHIRRVQQIASAHRELAELLNERRRRQSYAVAEAGGADRDEAADIEQQGERDDQRRKGRDHGALSMPSAIIFTTSIQASHTPRGPSRAPDRRP